MFYISSQHILTERFLTTMRSNKLYLVRHLETRENKSGIILGQKNIQLDKNSTRRFKVTKFPPVQAILCSPLQRCVVTAELIKEQYPSACNMVIPIMTLPQLLERNMGIWEGKLKKEVMNNNISLFRSNYMIPSVTPPKGESLEEFVKRGHEVLKIAKSKLSAGSLMLCSHNQMLKLIIHLYYNDRSLGHWNEISLQYGLITDIGSFEEMITSR